MIRVTKAEVRKMTKEYCICRNCHYAFRITDEERKEYQDLRCGNCSSIAFYYAGYDDPLALWLGMEDKDVGLVDSIIDPEPTQPQEQYVVGTLHVGNHIYTFEEANLKADEAAKNTQGEKVLVLKVINTRVATSKIEYERS